MAGLTTASLLPAKVQGYYDKRFLLRTRPNLVAYDHAQKRSLPKNNGTTVNFMRYMPLTKVTSALTETADGGLVRANRQQISSNEITATIATWGDYVEISRIASLTSIDSGISEKVDLVAQQAGESLDYEMMKTLCLGCSRRRADNDATYQATGTVDSATTTTIVDNALTQLDDFWNGGFVTITAGTNYGETRQVSDFANATGTVTVSSAFPVACDTTSKYRIVVGTGLAASDVLTTAVARLGVRDLERGHALNFEKGYKVAIIDPDLKYDFMGDATWLAAAQYKDSVDSLYTGEIGRWLGIRFVATTQLYRESVAGVEADGTGAVHVVPLMGAEAFGVVELAGEGNAKNGRIIIRTPAQLGQPLDMTGTIGWQALFKARMLNANFAVGMMCGATA